METNRTDKDMLLQGIKKIAISLILMFAGPSLFYITTSNKEKPFYILLLIISLILCGGAIYFAFKGIQTIMNSIFGKKTNSN